MAFFSRAFEKKELHDPSAIKAIFSNTWLAPVWLLVRVYVGYQWLLAGSDKVWGNTRWIAVSGPDGLGLKAYWERAIAVNATGTGPIKYDWYRHFLSFMDHHGWYHWFAWVVAFGEMGVGVALIVGAFTGVAALAGATMNFNYLMAGSSSTNPVLFILAVLLLLGWKVSGWIGIDRWLLPALGTPWEPGTAVKAITHHEQPGAPRLTPRHGPA